MSSNESIMASSFTMEKHDEADITKSKRRNLKNIICCPSSSGCQIPEIKGLVKIAVLFRRSKQTHLLTFSYIQW